MPEGLDESSSEPPPEITPQQAGDSWYVYTRPILSPHVWERILKSYFKYRYTV